MVATTPLAITISSTQSLKGGEEERSLSELCMICHIDIPKYRCPRCTIRTCSLPCTRRHKTWSQCSGVRDPAAFLRRSELTTPAAFDCDFNFITAIERHIERAQRDTEARGIPLDYRGRYVGGSGDISRKRKWSGAGDGQQQRSLKKGEAGFLRGARASGVRVERAPTGLSRSKQNTSRWNPKHKCLSWTVEWIFSDDDSGNTTKQRKPPTAMATRKILRNNLETITIVEAYTRIHHLHLHPSRKNDEVKQRQEQNNTSHTSFYLHCPPRIPTTATNSDGGDDGGSSGSHGIPTRRLQQQTKILIPLDPDMTFTAALCDRTVLEFPTIYVLPFSKQELDQPDEGGKNRSRSQGDMFILEKDYLGRMTNHHGGGSIDGTDDDDDDSDDGTVLSESESGSELESTSESKLSSDSDSDSASNSNSNSGSEPETLSLSLPGDYDGKEK